MSALFYVSYFVLWILVAVIAVLLLLIYRHFGLMTLGTIEGVQRDGLPLGEVAPALAGVSPDGTEVSWRTATGRAHLLLFATPDCGPCAEVMPYVNRLAQVPTSDVAITAIVPGPRAEAERLVEEYGARFECLAEDSSGAFDRYRVRVTPFAFVIGEDGRIRSKGLCSDPHRLEALLAAGGRDEAAGMVGRAATAT
jgi:peroxiredoxin